MSYWIYYKLQSFTISAMTVDDHLHYHQFNFILSFFELFIFLARSDTVWVIGWQGGSFQLGFVLASSSKKWSWTEQWQAIFHWEINSFNFFGWQTLYLSIVESSNEHLGCCRTILWVPWFQIFSISSGW